MKNTSLMFKEKQGLKEIFNSNLNDEVFSDIVQKLNIDKSKLYKYTSRLENSACEAKNCLGCKGLSFCKNELKGYVNMPILDNEDISFVYNACRYKKSELSLNGFKKNLSLFDVPSSLLDARIKDIYIDDKSRLSIIKYIDNYYKSYPSKELKGVYLHGNFGCGKTYLISALFNELAKKGVKSAIVYFPEFLRTLKASFYSGEDGVSYSDKYEYIKKIPLLLIDDIGAENVTCWGRDEVLGTLLQYRMLENLPTFFTSNLNLVELEEHLSITGKNEDKVKARRILERIKCLSLDIELIGKSRR
ncbi:MAG: primosomal protein DnaI [bacterium]|nr:primosomal protein DnaI [bacterium]